MHQGIPSQRPHSQGDEEAADLLIVLGSLQCRDEHDAAETHQPHHHHARHRSNPTLGGKVPATVVRVGVAVAVWVVMVFLRPFLGRAQVKVGHKGRAQVDEAPGSHSIGE